MKIGSFVEFRSPKMAPNPPYFLRHPLLFKNLYLSNQAKKGLEKYYLEKVCFIGFWCPDHGIFKFKDQRFLLNQQILKLSRSSLHFWCDRFVSKLYVLHQRDINLHLFDYTYINMCTCFPARTQPTPIFSQTKIMIILNSKYWKFNFKF